MILIVCLVWCRWVFVWTGGASDLDSVPGLVSLGICMDWWC